MGKFVKISCFILFLGSLLFGVVYPLAIWTVAHLFFPSKAEGSPLFSKKDLIGFKNIGQHFSSPHYFSSRPGVGLSPISGGSNLSWSSETLVKKVHLRMHFLQKENSSSLSLPHDLLMESASGFDPHISLKGALFQKKRVSLARNIPEEVLHALILQHKEMHLLGLFPDRINVLLLNQALDQLYPMKQAISTAAA